MQNIGETIMIVNAEREPDFSLYYLGSILLEILENTAVIPIEELLSETKKRLNREIHIDFLYYALDWLYLLSLVSIREGKMYYDNKKINSTQNKTF